MLLIHILKNHIKKKNQPVKTFCKSDPLLFHKTERNLRKNRKIEHLNATKENVLWKKSWHEACTFLRPCPCQTQGQTDKKEEERQLKEAKDLERNREQEHEKNSWEKIGEKLTGGIDG